MVLCYLLLLVSFSILSDSKPQWGYYHSSWSTTQSPILFNPYALQYLDPRGTDSPNMDKNVPVWLDSNMINQYCKCISLEFCPAAVSVLKSTPTDSQELDILRRLTCSFRGFQSSVCCNILIESLIYTRNKKKRAYFSYGGYGSQESHRGYGGGSYENNYWNHNNGGYNHQQPSAVQPNYDIDERNAINGNVNHIYWDDNFFPQWSHDPSRATNNGHHCGYGHQNNVNYNRKPGKRPKFTTTTTTTEEPYIIDVVEPEVPVTEPEPPPIPPTTTITAEAVTMPPIVTDPPPVPETTAVVVVEVPDVRAVKRSMFAEQICGTKIESRIVGGEDANLGDYPWMARLGYRRNSQPNILFRCGGTLISNRYIVTAAHCTVNLPSGLQLVLIRLGEFDERTAVDCTEGSCADPPRDVNIESTVVHSSYNVPRLANDIALIRMIMDIQFTNYVSPLCLPFPDTMEKASDLTGLFAVVAGWGSTNTGFTSGSPILRWVRLRIIPSEECATRYTRFNISINLQQQICTGGLENMDACEGDSGGPLFLEPSQQRRATLVGIVSFGARRCGTAAVPGVYTRVENYLDWILDTIST